jgi:Xaa-Pro dipeptidase
VTVADGGTARPGDNGPGAQARAAEIATKLRRVRDLLDARGWHAALFASQPGVAWITAGLEDKIVRNEEPGLVWALITATDAHLITTNIEQPRLTAEEGAGDLGFAVHAVPWYEPAGLAAIAADLAASEPEGIVNDGSGPGWRGCGFR